MRQALSFDGSVLEVHALTCRPCAVIRGAQPRHGARKDVRDFQLTVFAELALVCRCRQCVRSVRLRAVSENAAEFAPELAELLANEPGSPPPQRVLHTYVALHTATPTPEVLSTLECLVWNVG